MPNLDDIVNEEATSIRRQRRQFKRGSRSIVCWSNRIQKKGQGLLDAHDPPSIRFTSGNGDTVPLQVELEKSEMELKIVCTIRVEVETKLKGSRTRSVESYAAPNGRSSEGTEFSDTMVNWVISRQM